MRKVRGKMEDSGFIGEKEEVVEGCGGGYDGPLLLVT